jgi:putative transposase
MYEYYKLSLQQRQELVKQRLKQGFPPHSPPHPLNLEAFYLLTVACYQHQPILTTSSRRQHLLNLIFEQFIHQGFEITAWVVLINHYHLLVYLHDFTKLSSIFQKIHGSTSYQWNSEDQQRGRKVWYRFSDRAIRSERHYYATLNYIHYNPVKHNCVNSPYDWNESSLHWYLKVYGREWLRDGWAKYPIKDYGKGWDD